MDKKGHWYTDKNGHHYFVEDGQTPQEGWEASKRRKMIDGGKYKVSEDGDNWEDVDEDTYNKYEADKSEFDENIDDDFGFDEEEDEYNREMEKAQEENAMMSEGEDEPTPEEEKQYVDKCMEDIAKASDKKAFEYISDNIDDLTEAGLISGETSDRLYEELDKKIDESGEKMPLYNSKMSKESEPAEEDENSNPEGSKEDDDKLNPNNPKYKDFSRSRITNARLVDEGKKVHDYDKNEDRTWSIIEYIPYGALQDGENRKLYGVVSDYDGSDSPDIGAIVSPSLESAKEDLEQQIQLAEQGSERYLKKGKWDEDWFKMLNDKEYDWDEDTKKKYSEKYGWDFSKPWEEQAHMKSDGGYTPLPKYRQEKGHIVVEEGPLKGQSFDNESDLLDHIKRYGEK